jgi:hypothetical protein
MGFLGTFGFGLIFGRLGWQKPVSVTFCNVLACFCLGTLGDIGRVGTHVGDQTHRTLSQVDAFVELLCQGHGASGSIAQTPGSLLLHGAGGKWGRGLAPALTALDLRDSVCCTFHILEDRLDGGLIPQDRVGIIHLCQLGNESLLELFRAQLSRNGPVFDRVEGLNLTLAFDDQAQGNRLNATGG